MASNLVSVVPNEGAHEDQDNSLIALAINPSTVLKLHFCVIVVLLGCSLAATVAMFAFETGPVDFFLLNSEANLPTFVSTFMLLEAAVLLAAIAGWSQMKRDRFTSHWAVLAAIFFLMAMDEAAQVHEKFIDPFHYLFGFGGFLTNAWVLPGFVFVILAGLYFFRFIVGIDRDISRIFVVSALIYLTGVMGVEMISGYFKSSEGFHSLEFVLSINVEEALEMVGIAIFIYGLCKAMTTRGLTLAVTTTRRESSDP